MEIKKNIENAIVTIAISGRLDTTTAPQLEEEIRSLVNPKNITLDFGNLEYISSAGLRVVLATSKIIKAVGEFKVINVSEEIHEIFEMTGFLDIITIERK